jgi:hypothetical protein
VIEVGSLPTALGETSFWSTRRSRGSMKSWAVEMYLGGIIRLSRLASTTPASAARITSPFRFHKVVRIQTGSANRASFEVVATRVAGSFSEAAGLSVLLSSPLASPVVNMTLRFTFKLRLAEGDTCHRPRRHRNFVLSPSAADNARASSLSAAAGAREGRRGSSCQNVPSHDAAHVPIRVKRLREAGTVPFRLGSLNASTLSNVLASHWRKQGPSQPFRL